MYYELDPTVQQHLQLEAFEVESKSYKAPKVPLILRFRESLT